MTSTLHLLAAATLVVVGAGLPGCSKSSPKQPAPLAEVVAKKVAADLSKPDPAAGYWATAPSGIVTLTAQPSIAPRPATTTTSSVTVQAVNDGSRIAFRLRWKDTERSEGGHLGEYSDAFALQFPVKDGPPPSVMMGGKDTPVHLFHWRAQYQRDKEQGKPTMKQLYPNISVDMYPLEFKDAPGGTEAEREVFSPGRAQGNPQSYEKMGGDETIAEGFSTSSVQAGHGSVAHAEWKDGEWTLVIVRPLVVEGGSTLKAGSKGNMAFAAWQGGKGEVGSRKCVSLSWTPVSIE